MLVKPASTSENTRRNLCTIESLGSEKVSHKKRRKGIIDEFFEGSLFTEGDDIFEEIGKGRASCGYSIRVTQTSEGTKVYATVGKDTDANELRRQLQRQYPNAQIEIEGVKPLIREISTKSTEEETPQDEPKT